MKQSYRYINQIFYNDNKFDIPESIETLEKYCLSNEKLMSLKKKDENLENIFPQKNPENNPPEKKEGKNSPEISENIFPPKVLENKNTENNFSQKNPENKKEERGKWFYPKQTDTVFWCIFSFVHGFDEYNEIGHSYGNIMLEEKMKIVEFIKKTPKVLKESNVKITNMGIQEVISEFMVDSTTSFHGIAALAIYYKIQIFLIHPEKNIYLKFLDSSECDCEKQCYIYYDTYARGQIKYKIPICVTHPPNLDSMVCLESHLKPFRPASHYKIDDLVNISQKIGFVYETRMKKTDIYNKLTELCAWL
jgi:hypothetical protein